MVQRSKAVEYVASKDQYKVTIYIVYTCDGSASLAGSGRGVAIMLLHVSDRHSCSSFEQDLLSLSHVFPEEILQTFFRGPPFNLQEGQGFGDGPKYFVHYGPADTYIFFSCSVIELFISLLLWNYFQLYLEGNYLFQHLAATNYLFYHLLALNYLFKRSPFPPPGD